MFPFTRAGGSQVPRFAVSGQPTEGGFKTRMGGFQKMGGVFQNLEGGFKSPEGGFKSSEGGFKLDGWGVSKRRGVSN